MVSSYGMAVKPSNVIAPPAPATVKLSPEQRTLVDEFGELDRKYRLWNPDLKRYEALKHIIKPWFRDLPGDQAATAQGTTYTLNVTPCEQESTPEKKRIYRLLGPKLFLEVAEITQKALKAALETLKKTDQFDQCFTKPRTGSRILSAVQSAPAPVPPAAKAA